MASPLGLQKASRAMPATYAELHSHTNFSFLHGASPVEDMVDPAPDLGLAGLAVTGYRSLCRLVSRANLDGTKRVPRFTQALLAQHTEGILALSGGREGEIARRLRVGDREGARAAAERHARLFGTLHIELSHHLLPDDDWLVAEHVDLADELGLPVVVTNDVHYARPEDRELHDVLTGIFHGRTLDTLGDLRRPDGESYLKSAADLAALPPADAGASDIHAGTSDGHAGTSSARTANA